MVQWFRDTSKEFFNLSTTIKDNVQKVEYESGRIKTWLKSQTMKKQHSVSFYLKSKTEENAFYSWFENTLKCGSLSVELPNLITQEGNKEYLFESQPAINGTHYPKVMTINLIEV